MKPLIVANWKMNPSTLAEAKQLFDSVKKGIKNACPERSQRVEVVICPPFIYLPVLKQKVKGVSSLLNFGGQSCFWEEKGAFTGEISPLMLKNLGIRYVIIGHSERRALGETDKMINKKLKAVLSAKLIPILCFDNLTQVRKDLKGTSKKVILAYEPVWAIGTGKPCPPEKAKEMRETLKSFKRVLYGGSVNSQNARDYIEKAGFQGFIVGGASLRPKEFIRIIRNVS